MSEEKLPKGWRLSSLKELFNLYYGKGLPTSELTDEGFNVYGANGIIGKFNQFLFENPMLIISCRGAASGAIHKTTPRSFVTSNSIILDIISHENIDLDYAKYSMIHADKSSVITGTAQPQITIQLLQNLKLPIAPLPEQQQIVAKLDAVFGHLDRVREKLDRIPELLKNFRQQVLTQAVTGELTREWREGKDLGEWEQKRLEEFSESKLGKMLDQAKNKGELTDYLRNINVRWFEIDFSDLYQMRIEKSELHKYELKFGDVLVCEGGEPGRAAIWKNQRSNVIFQKALHRIRLSEEVLPEYFLYNLFIDASTETLNELFTGTTIKHLTGKSFAKYEIDLPPKEEQQEIVKRVDVLFGLADKIESQYQSLKSKIDQMPQAILAKAFRGELVDQEVKEYVREVGELGMAAEGMENYG